MSVFERLAVWLDGYPLTRARTRGTTPAPAVLLLLACVVAASPAHAQQVTMTFDTPASTPPSYTEQGMTVAGYDAIGSSSHVHLVDNRLYMHSGNSEDYRWTSLSGESFDLVGFIGGAGASGTTTAYAIRSGVVVASQSIGVGQQVFSGAGWKDIDLFRILTTGAYYVDDFVVVRCGSADGDADGIGNLCDNCPSVANPGQGDADANGIGDACEAVEQVPVLPPIGVALLSALLLAVGVSAAYGRRSPRVPAHRGDERRHDADRGKPYSDERSA